MHFNYEENQMKFSNICQFWYFYSFLNLQNLISRDTLRRQEQQVKVDKLAAIVDKLSMKWSPEFARYVHPSPPNHELQQDDVDKQQYQAYRKKLAAIWDLFFEPDPPPPSPVYTPCRLPKVNWGRLNKNYVRNLPDPQPFRIHSCPADPTFHVKKYLPPHEHPPFGVAYCIQTSEGPVALPDEPIHCYVWRGEWVVHATVD